MQNFGKKSKKRTKSKRKSIKSIRKSKSKTSSLVDKCCMCENRIRGDYLVPSKCLKEHGSVAHKICGDCWWKKDGFATEGTNHECPGCVKKLPLSNKTKQPVIASSKPENVIDLTEE